MRSEDLIRTLASEAKPVRRLAHPAWRVAYWLLISLIYVAVVVLIMRPRPDIGVKLGEPRFVLEIGAAFLTGVMAAAAAFCAGCPGRPFWERLTPLPMLVLWLGSLAEGCWRGWGSGVASLRPDLVCLPNIVLASLVPGGLILYMIRRGAPLAPALTAALAALAASALSAAALRLYHVQDASMMVLVWQFGSVAFITALGALIGRNLLRWPERRIASGAVG